MIDKRTDEEKREVEKGKEKSEGLKNQVKYWKNNAKNESKEMERGKAE